MGFWIGRRPQPGRDPNDPTPDQPVEPGEGPTVQMSNNVTIGNQPFGIHIAPGAQVEIDGHLSIGDGIPLEVEDGGIVRGRGFKADAQRPNSPKPPRRFWSIPDVPWKRDRDQG